MASQVCFRWDGSNHVAESYIGGVWFRFRLSCARSGSTGYDLTILDTEDAVLEVARAETDSTCLSAGIRFFPQLSFGSFGRINIQFTESQLCCIGGSSGGSDSSGGSGGSAGSGSSGGSGTDGSNSGGSHSGAECGITCSAIVGPCTPKRIRFVADTSNRDCENCSFVSDVELEQDPSNPCRWTAVSGACATEFSPELLFVLVYRLGALDMTIGGSYGTSVGWGLSVPSWDGVTPVVLSFGFADLGTACVWPSMVTIIPVT